MDSQYFFDLRKSQGDNLPKGKERFRDQNGSNTFDVKYKILTTVKEEKSFDE